MFMFNGIDFSTKIKVAAGGIKRPFISPSKLSSISIEGKDADIFQRKNATSYNIDVDFYIFSDFNSTLMSAVRDLTGDLDTDFPAELIFNDEPDKYYMVVLDNVSQPEYQGNRVKATISFKVFDPYAYAIDDDIFTYTASGQYNFTRKGNTASLPLIEIQGTSGSYTLSDGINTMMFTGTINTGEKLIIDSNLVTAYILGADGVTKTSAINQLSTLDFLVLKKGTNNFTISTSGGAVLSQCKLTCNSRWK